MKNLLRLIVVAPIAIVFLVFAFANRHIVTVSFDPFVEGDIPAFALSAPLFVVLILALMLGVIAGGVATWLAEGKYRRAARNSRAEADQLRLETARLRAEAQAARAVASDNRNVSSLSLQHHA
jgi:uncharacterized integral membrane protein